MTHRTGLALAALLVFYTCCIVPAVAAPTVYRAVTSSDEAVTITFTVDAEQPFALGIVESVPEGWAFAETNSTVYTASHYEIDRDERKIAFFVCNEKEISYNLEGTGDGSEGFVAQWVDLCELSPNPNEGKERWHTVGDSSASTSEPAALDTATQNKIEPTTVADSLPLGAEGKLTEDLVGTSVCGYMLGTSDLTLDEVSDAAYVYAFWGGEPKTVTDMADRTVTLYRPIERIINDVPDSARMVIALGDGHLLVGSDISTVKYGAICPRVIDQEIICKECWEGVVPGGLDNLPVVSGTGGSSPNYELIASLSPDIVFVSLSSKIDMMEECVGAPVFAGSPGFTYESVKDNIRVMGAILSKEREAEDLITFMDSKVKLVTDVTDTIPESEKPRVYFASRGARGGLYDAKSGDDFTRTTNTYYPLTMAGGINLANDCAGTSVNVGLEQIIAWNPDVILLASSRPEDYAKVDFILNAPELQSIKAVQEGRVYSVYYPYASGYSHDRNFLNVIYIAKILYPDKFADIDMDEEGEEIEYAFVGVHGLYSAYADYLKFPRDQEIL